MRTGKIHCYTVIQVLALAFLVGIKLSPLAPSFPFFIICLIPLRKLLTRFYKEEELEEVRWPKNVQDHLQKMLPKFLNVLTKIRGNNIIFPFIVLVSFLYFIPWCGKEYLGNVRFSSSTQVEWQPFLSRYGPKKYDTFGIVAPSSMHDACHIRISQWPNLP